LQGDMEIVRLLLTHPQTHVFESEYHWDNLLRAAKSHRMVRFLLLAVLDQYIALRGREHQQEQNIINGFFGFFAFSREEEQQPSQSSVSDLLDFIRIPSTQKLAAAQFFKAYIEADVAARADMASDFATHHRAFSQGRLGKIYNGAQKYIKYLDSNALAVSDSSQPSTSAPASSSYSSP